MERGQRIVFSCALALLGACASTPDSGAGTQQTSVFIPPGPTQPQPAGPVAGQGAITPIDQGGQQPPPVTPTMPVDTGVPQAGAAAPAVPDPTVPDPTAMVTGVSQVAIDYMDPEMQCYEFRAHAPGNTSAPMNIGIANDKYIDVDFPAPWTATVYARSFHTLIDNAEVLHHWLFYKGGSSDGQRSLMQGWAPGGTDAYYTPDLGMEMPAEGYSIQYHYNSGDASAVDASGVEVCVTPTKPTNVATVSWLGTDAINGTSATGTCDPTTNERVHILAGSPHMHKKGIHFKVVLTRASGAQEVLHDMPFDFAYQQGYTNDVWVEPGDKITTTCTYSAPSTFGPGTSDEMCYWFAVHYPANGLTDGGIIGNLIHGPNTCLGM